MKYGNLEVAIGIVYFPQDNDTASSQNATDLCNELVQNIGELQNKFTNILLLGDFNGKVTKFRQSGKPSSNGVLLENLITATDTVLVNTTDKCRGSITWSRGPQSSTIDYAISSSHLFNNVETMIVDEDQDYSIGSDHNTIVLKIKVAKSNPDINSTSPQVQKWNILNNSNWAAYRTAIANSFSDWDVTEHRSVDEMWADFSTRIKAAGTTSIGVKSYRTKKLYWDKEVTSLIQDRKQANRLYRVWSKHPNSSPEMLSLLWDDYKEKKKRVSQKVQQSAIQNKIKVIIKNSKTATRNPRAFWRMLSKSNRKCSYPIQIRDPDHPEIIIDNPLIIKEKLTSYWSSLGNGTSQDTSPATDHADRLVSKVPLPDSLNSIMFDIKHLKAAIKKLRNGKATGKDNIPGEFLKNGGEILDNALHSLFQKIKLCEKIPDEWYEGLVKPLFKEGSREQLNNYRGITISSIVYKVLVTIIEEQTMQYVENKNILGEYQGAFRKHRRCEDHIFSLKGICSIRKTKKKRTYLAFLDVSKAFDTVDRSRLFSHLWNSGIQGKAWNLIQMLYAKVDNKVIFGPFESDLYEVNNGVKQGCVLSPLLFNLVIADLENMLQNVGGVPVGNTNVNALFYADDIILFAENDIDLQLMLNVADSFAKKWNLTFNEKKSQILVVGKRMTTKEWQMGNKVLKETKSYKYLGVIINRQLKDNQHILEHVSSKAKKMNTYVRYTLAKHLDINRIHFGNTMWHSAVQPSISHAAGVWFNNTKQTTDKLHSIQYQFAKAVLKLRSSPAATSTLAELGWLPLIDQLNVSRISYFCHIQAMENHRLPKLIYEMLLNLHVKNESTVFNYVENVKSILEHVGLDHMFVKPDTCSVRTFKSLSSQHHIAKFTEDISSHSSLTHFRMVKQSTFLSEYLTCRSDFKSIQLKFKLRNGVSGIGEDLYRQRRGNGLCKFCGCFESMNHFLFYCHAYSLDRVKLFTKLKVLCDENVFNMFIQDLEYAKYMLLGDYDDVVNNLSLQFLSDIWSTRDSF